MGRSTLVQEGLHHIAQSPAHVLLTFDAYEELVGPQRALDLLAEPAGVADVEFVTTKSADAAQSATFE